MRVGPAIRVTTEDAARQPPGTSRVTGAFGGRQYTRFVMVGLSKAEQGSKLLVFQS